MPEDDTIGRIMRADLDRLPLLPPERWVPRARAKRVAAIGVGHRLMRGVIAVSAAALLLVGALAVGSAVRALRSSPAAAEPRPAVAHPLGICAAAQDRVIGTSSIVTRLDRIAVKRMTVQDLDAGRTAGGIPPSQPAATRAGNTVLCVVAVSGEIRQSFGLLDTGPFKWAVFVSIAGGDEPTISSSAGNNGNWPSYFDALPDRQGEPYPGTVVEVLGSDALSVRLESAMLSAEFGNPVLVEANKYTLIQPGAANVAATGVRSGDRVAIFFEREGRNPSTGAYPLSIFRLNDATLPTAGAPTFPVCPAGQLPTLDIAQTPPGDQPGTGAATPEAAFNKAFPTIREYRMYEFGTTNQYRIADGRRGPVWIVADGRTYIALNPGSPGQNNWFAHPATFLGCRTPSNVGASPLASAMEGSRRAPVSTAEIVARLSAAGLSSRVSPPPPSRLLLYNATDLDLVAVDDPAIKGFVVYRYPSIAAATAAFRLNAVRDPTRSTVDYVAKPYFVGIGDALVVFATSNEATARHVIAALTS